jgi:FKBP-type peptidyl-prolyl cis-trans isomerase
MTERTRVLQGMQKGLKRMKKGKERMMSRVEH